MADAGEVERDGEEHWNTSTPDNRDRDLRRCQVAALQCGAQLAIVIIKRRDGGSVVERWALKFAGESEALASYSIANQLSSPVNLAVLSWNLESSARSGEVFRSEGTEGLRRNLRRVTKHYLLVSALPSALILALLPLVRPVFGDRYGDVIWYAPFLLAAIAIEACYNPPNQVAYYTGHSGRIAAATTFSAVAAMVASAVLVPQFGAWGAAAARIIAALSRTGAMWYTAYDCLLVASTLPKARHASTPLPLPLRTLSPVAHRPVRLGSRRSQRR